MIYLRRRSEINNKEINEKLKPIAQKAKIINEVCKEIIKDFEQQAMIILELDKEYNSDGKIKITIRQDGTIEIRLETVAQTTYFYPLNSGFQPMKSKEEKKKIPKHYFVHSER